MRTLLLREREPRECRLRRDEVDFLLARHRGHVEVVPTRERGRYRLTPLGHVGTILTPSCRLVIRPKIPLANLFFLLGPSAPLPFLGERVDGAAAPELLDLLGLRLAQLLAERVAAGLHRGYAERSTTGPYLQGRLDVPQQQRTTPARKETIPSVWEEFTADVPCNQVPRAVAERVLLSPFVSDPVRAALRTALVGYAGIGPTPLDANALARAAPDRRTEAYRPLYDLCCLLADGLASPEAAGPATGPAFLLDMERLFEGHVIRHLRAAFAEDSSVEVGAQVTWTVARPGLTMRPDVVLSRAGRPRVVLDMKWKEIEDTAPPTDDVYQVLAYAAALGAPHAALVYPGRRDRSVTYRLAETPRTLTVRTSRVVGRRDRLERGVQRLIAWARRRLAERDGP